MFLEAKQINKIYGYDLKEVILMAGKSNLLKPDYYISETRFDRYGNKITIHRNPNPDRKMQLKEFAGIADILMLGVQRSMIKNKMKN